MVKRHFEAGLYFYFWINASVLAAIAGRPWLGLVGLVTVLPWLVVYAGRTSGAAKSYFPPSGAHRDKPRSTRA